MLLYEKIEALEALFASAKESLQSEANTALQSALLKIETSLQETKVLLEQTITTKQKQAFSALELATQQQVSTLFSQEKESLIALVGEKIDLTNLAHNIAIEFAQENLAALESTLQKLLSDGEHSLQKLALASLERFQSELKSRIAELKSYSLEPLARELVQEFLDTNKNEILRINDFSFLQEFLQESKVFAALLENAAKEQVQEIVTKEVVNDNVLELLQASAQEVFAKTLALKELQKQRFAASIILANMNVQCELAHITRIMDVLAELELAKKRLEAYEDLDTSNLPSQKIYLEV